MLILFHRGPRVRKGKVELKSDKNRLTNNYQYYNNSYTINII